MLNELLHTALKDCQMQNGLFINPCFSDLPYRFPNVGLAPCKGIGSIPLLIRVEQLCSCKLMSRGCSAIIIGGNFVCYTVVSTTREETHFSSWDCPTTIFWTPRFHCFTLLQMSFSNEHVKVKFLVLQWIYNICKNNIIIVPWLSLKFPKILKTCL